MRLLGCARRVPGGVQPAFRMLLPATCGSLRFKSGDLMGGFRYAGDTDGSAKVTEESLKQKRAASMPVSSSATAAAAADHSAPSSGYNPWEVLGLKPGATQHDIRMRYHEMIKTCHPDLDPNGGNIGMLNQINKAYELISKSPTLDKRYRGLVSDTQYFYYKFLPEWMAKNVDEMPRYWSWVKWRTPSVFVIFLWLAGAWVVGRFYAAFPFFTSCAMVSIVIDVLFHTMIAPAVFSMLFMNAVMTSQSYSLSWLTSPKSFLKRELGY